MPPKSTISTSYSAHFMIFFLTKSSYIFFPNQTILFIRWFWCIKSFFVHLLCFCIPSEDSPAHSLPSLSWTVTQQFTPLVDVAAFKDLHLIFKCAQLSEIPQQSKYMLYKQLRKSREMHMLSTYSSHFLHVVEVPVQRDRFLRDISSTSRSQWECFSSRFLLYVV